MADLTRYRVLREHVGDKAYSEGDERIAAAGDVVHLVPRVLEKIGPAEPDADAKAEPPALNKAEDAAPANKASTGRKA